jgi:hypothetical protein
MSGRSTPQDDPAGAAPIDQRLTPYRFVIAGTVAALGFTGDRAILRKDHGAGGR